VSLCLLQEVVQVQGAACLLISRSDS